MQMPTHLITAVLIDKLFERCPLPCSIKNPVAGASCYLSHGVLDILAKATYHPPDPMPEDRFWSAYHRIIPVVSGAILLRYGKRHKLSMFCALLPDLDWVVRAIRQRNSALLPFWQGPVLHESLSESLLALPTLKLLHELPDWRYRKRAALIEIGLTSILSCLVLMLGNRRSS